MKKILSLALIIGLMLSLSIAASAASAEFLTVEEAAAGKTIIANPQYITGGDGFNEAEGSASLFDNDVNTKYCTDQFPYFAEWKYDKAYVVDRIILATANDNEAYPRRMIDGWTLSGSNDGSSWTVIYTGKTDDVENVNFTYYFIDLPDNKEAFQYYKINSDDYAMDQDQAIIQLSEVVLCGAEPAPEPEPAPAVEEPAAPAEAAPVEAVIVEAAPAPAPAPAPVSAPRTSDNALMVMVFALVSLGAAVVVSKKSFAKK